MDVFRREDHEEEAELLKALGHPTRLWIVRQLADGEHCVCDFVNAVGVKFATVSQHLAVLKQAGILSDEKRGKSVFYRLADARAAGILECLEKGAE